MIFKHIRPHRVHRRNKKDRLVQVYPDSSGITICYRPSETRKDGQWVLVGVSFCPPNAKFWDRKRANIVAGARSHDSPVQFQFEGLDEELSVRHVIQAVRTLMIEEPKWEPADTHPLRPHRFSHRYGAALFGPSGSLLTAYIDVKVREMDQEAPRGKVIFIQDKYGKDSSIDISRNVQISHWALRVPDWAPALLKEA